MDLAVHRYTIIGMASKDLTYEILSNTTVVSIEGEAKGKVQVLVNGNLVNDARLLILKVCNTGNVPILAEDYKDPLTISFRGNTEILDAEVIKKNPENLKA